MPGITLGAMIECAGIGRPPSAWHHSVPEESRGLLPHLSRRSHRKADIRNVLRDLGKETLL
jgi:hypothetical protein